MTLIVDGYHEIPPPKICLNEYLTCRVSEHPSKKTWEMCRETVGIWTTGPIQYLLITVKVLTLEKVDFIDIQNPKTVC